MHNEMISVVNGLNFSYFNDDFEALPENIDSEEARQIVNSDRYIVKQAFHEFRNSLAKTADKNKAIHESAYLLDSDEQVNLFLDVILASELYGQSGYGIFLSN